LSIEIYKWWFFYIEYFQVVDNIMKIFELTIIGIMGLCTVFLSVITIAKERSVRSQSPKANFSKIVINFPSGIVGTVGNSELLSQSNAVGMVRPTVRYLSAKFMTLDYDLNDIREEGASVPRVFVVNMPQDMPHIQLPADRKNIFFKTVLPLILKANDEILADRKRLLFIHQKKIKFTEIAARDKLWLVVLCERYNVGRTNLLELLRRVDIVPPSIALAQAAEESGWGTSRFTLEGNALFGQWTFGDKNLLVPKARDVGKEHGVRSFRSLLGAVRSYVLNLNTHRAYRGFRKERQNLRRKGLSVTGSSLVSTLTSYSERGKKYVRNIQTIIDSNKLQNLDTARLGS
jgi:Bax protein